MRQIFISGIRISYSARCPVARGSGRVMSAAEMPREEWLTSHTAPTCLAPRRPQPASAPAANGAPGSGLLWVKTAITVSNQYRCFPFWVITRMFIFPTMFKTKSLKQNGHLLLLWSRAVKYWFVNFSMTRVHSEATKTPAVGGLQLQRAGGDLRRYRHDLLIVC